MDSDTDDEYEHVSDFDMSESEDDNARSHGYGTPISTPETPRSLRPSELKNLPCPYDDCHKTFNRQARLKEHLRSHTNTRPFRCPFTPCNKDFLRDTHLKRHMKSAHSNIRDYKCTWHGCSKSFATGTRLRRHEEAHQGREKYRCHGYDGCTAAFRKHDTLARHVTTVHEHMKPFSCPETDSHTGEQCRMAFDTAEKLRAHQRTKHDPTRFVCTECLEHQTRQIEAQATAIADLPPVYFATYTDLQKHIAVVHPPTCSLCLTSFRTLKELTRHLELQHGYLGPDASPARPQLVCTYPECGRNFTKKGNLNVHIKTVHEKRKDFVCGETEVNVVEAAGNQPLVYGCNQEFTSKASLEEHVRTSHFGLISRRQQREKQRNVKRLAKSQADDSPKARRPRKDKGVKKSSAIASLLGTVVPPQKNSAFQLHDDDNDDYEYDDDLDDNYEPAQELTSSTTLYGSQIYHTDAGHHNHILPIAMSRSYFPIDEQDENLFRHRNSNDDDHDDFIFDGFEPNDILDPFLLQQ